MKLNKNQKAELNKFLEELCGYATYQFRDKHGEWGIEEFLFTKLGVKDPYSSESEDDSPESVDAAEDVLADAREYVVEQFTKTFKAGLSE